MQVASFKKLPKILDKRLYPGKYRWYLGKLCNVCQGKGRYKPFLDEQECDYCYGVGRVGLRASIYRWWRLPTPSALPSRDWGSKDGEYTWEDWEIDMRKEYPIRYFFQRTVPYGANVLFLYTFKRAYHWIRYHTWRREHILDLSDKRNCYTYGWIDPDKAILFAAFKIFVSFYESDANYVDWTDNVGCREAHEKMQMLYDWWKTTRPKLLKECASHGDFLEVEEKDQKMLGLLMEVRPYLWA